MYSATTNVGSITQENCSTLVQMLVEYLLSVESQSVHRMVWYTCTKYPLVHYQDGRLKNNDELLNLRALKFSPVNKSHIFQCMGKIFHTKYLTHSLKDTIWCNIEILSALRFKSWYTFFTPPPPPHMSVELCMNFQVPEKIIMVFTLVTPQAVLHCLILIFVKKKNPRKTAVIRLIAMLVFTKLHSIQLV